MTGWLMAIDYGTSYTTVALQHGPELEVLDVDDARRFPSGVLLSDDGTLLTGPVAASEARRAPDRYEHAPKRLVGQPAALLGEQVVPVVDMVAAVLRRVGEAARQREGGSAPAGVRITHPASWRGERQEVLREAARRAGVGEVELLSEPEAAAWYFVRDRRGDEPEIGPGQSVAVYDLGGGTFDTAILRREADTFVLAGAPGGDDQFGGDVLDDRLVDHVLARLHEREPDVWRELKRPTAPRWERALLLLREDVRRVKEALSTRSTATVGVSAGDDVIDVEVTRGEFEALIRSDVERSIEILESTARSAGVGRADIAAIYLTGGSSRIPLVAAMVSSFHPRTYSRPDPKTLVAAGAIARPAAVEPGAEPVPAPAQTPVATQSAPSRGERRRPRRRVALPALGALLALAGAGVGAVSLGVGRSDSPPPSGGQGGRQGPAALPYDFDGDGRGDLVAGMPSFRVQGNEAAGAVVVLAGAGKHRPLVIHEGTKDVPGDPQRRGLFAAAVSSADFDRDGYADLAIGGPGLDTAPAAGFEGAVTVLYGSAKGVLHGRRQVLPGPESDGGTSARYGAALAAGDLDGDGYPDLLVGAPGDAVKPGAAGSGSVRILFGRTGGLDPKQARTLARPRNREAGFGSLLAIGKVDRDDNPDVAEAAPGNPYGTQRVTVPGHGSYCPGSTDGPRHCRVMGGGPAGGPTALAIGDVTGDGISDVVQGAAVNAYVEAPADTPAGAVLVWPGGGGGPRDRPRRITQETTGVPGNDQAGDGFGAAIALGDVYGDGHLELIVGAPGEDFAAGRITILPTSRSGSRIHGARAYGQADPGLPGAKAPGHGFGAAVTSVDANGDGHRDLAVAAPGDDDTAGSLTIVPASRGGLRLGRARRVLLGRLGGRSRKTATVIALGRSR